MPVHEELLARRADYPILAEATYLANHSLGAMHRASAARLAGFADEWATRGVLAWHDWLLEMAGVADLVGRIIGAPPGTTVLRQNVADLVGTVASALEFSGRRNRVVLSDLEWPGAHYLWSQHRKYGAEVTVVASSGDGVHLDPQRLIDEIDERTVIVPISLVLFRSATIVDVGPIVERAHAVGALVLLDAYQAAGVVPVDVTRLGVDFCVGGSVKYLCGGPGAGWLYVAPGLVDDLRPAQVGWFGHRAPFDFEVAEIEYAPGVMRFAGGTPGVPAAYGARAGYEAVLDVGVARIRERSVSLTQPLLESALERGWTVRSPHDPAWRGGHVTIDPGDGQRVYEDLIARGFYVDFRPGAGIRIGPHFFNTADECAAVIDEIDRIRKAS